MAALARRHGEGIESCNGDVDEEHHHADVDGLAVLDDLRIDGGLVAIGCCDPVVASRPRIARERAKKTLA
jgi:hypothetical protein